MSRGRSGTGSRRAVTERVGEPATSMEDATVLERITFDPKIMGGRACIRGMRIPVSVIVSQIASGATFEETLEGYPDLEREDIRQALEYAVSGKERDNVHPDRE